MERILSFQRLLTPPVHTAVHHTFKGNKMSLKRGDLVRITNKNNIEEEVIGFYAHSQDARVKTVGGHEWIISPLFLEKVVDNLGYRRCDSR